MTSIQAEAFVTQALYANGLTMSHEEVGKLILAFKQVVQAEILTQTLYNFTVLNNLDHASGLMQ